ncbi:hypothetical protein [Desulfitobacterium hafniense]|uniref:8-oxoguanine DNA glycosylase n=2 Tax=Desulfitobacterium hafniense TaxID=49338 RepID=Q24ZT7_DESHY|nr:hypothetical protein [Desulfitobacterium hafniense]KTE91834.1 hypothetical protein AT727_20370 [Desulfitobacterium hafniense]BAE82455.1 hypothetical protein DSY0666 [Desulfitobacterium hafniense Y51]
MESQRVEIILKKLWEMYGSSIEGKFDQGTDLYNEIMLEEFFFTLLGGFGISYELNKSALALFKQKGYLDSSLYDEQEKIIITARNLRDEFNIKQFEPKSMNGEYRKYRFIETKPIFIVKAGYWLWQECAWDLESYFSNHRDLFTREWLCSCPGIGMKSASWFLRNIGINDDYAVFDVHVLRFLEKLGVKVPQVVTEKAYIQLEMILREICKKIGVSLGKMDYLLWVLARNGYLAYVG